MGNRTHRGKRRREASLVEEFASPFIPAAEPARYKPPRANVDPDRSKAWWKRALPLVKAHKRTFIAALSLSVVGLIMQVQVPNLARRAIDTSLVAHRAALGGYVWWIVSLGAARWVTLYVSRRFLLQTGYAIEADLRNQMYAQFTRLSFSLYDKVQTGQLISRANSDVLAVERYLVFAPSIIVQCSIAVVAFVEMLFINARLALVAMVVLPFVYLVAVRMRSVMLPSSWLVQSRYADVATIVDENVNGVRVVKSFAAEGHQLRHLAEAADGVQWANIKNIDIRAKWSPLLENLPRVALALLLLAGGWMALEGYATVGTIVAFNAYVLMLQPPFRQLGMIILMGQRAAAGSQRIYEILDQQPEIADHPGAVDLVDGRGEVDFDDVSFEYDAGVPILAGFDLHLEPGETMAIVGRNGSGKSTLVKLLARFYEASEGVVRVGGKDVRELTLASLRASIGIVPDEPFLFSVSIRDNIAYGRPDASMDEIVAAAQAAEADEFIRELPEGYDTVVGERGYTLSGGQRQRIVIARTLLMNPPVLVFDEATSAIDVQVELQIHAAFRRLMRGRTTIIIAHRLSAIGLSQRVVLLDGGRIVAEGTHEELLATEPLYAEILAQGEQEAAELAAEQGERLSDEDAQGHDGKPRLGGPEPLEYASPGWQRNEGDA